MSSGIPPSFHQESRMLFLPILTNNLGKIAASVGAVEQAAKPIMDSVRSGCPSVPGVEMPPAS